MSTTDFSHIHILNDAKANTFEIDLFSVG